MTKQCAQCSKTFAIEPDDQAFYDKLKVPAPTLCPDCRMQRRLTWRNERFYYSRKCDKTGEPMISIYGPDSPIKRVYKNSVWFGDSWEALDYGRDFDFSRPFFEQFAELMREVPHVNLWAFDNDNADYNNCCSELKNSYMNSVTDRSEDSYYSYLSLYNRSVVDCTAVEHSELAIECIDSDKLYNCAYCQQCRNCLDTYLSFDCRDCKYVFGSTGLRHKDYYIYNKPVTPEQWQQQIPQLLASYKQLQLAQQTAHDLSLSIPRLFQAVFNSQDCTGNYIWNSNHCQLSYEVRQGQNIKYCAYAPWNAKDSMDCYGLGDCELLYDANFGPDVYNSQFCLWSLHGPNNSQYCILCVNGCDSLFGCVGLKKKKFCIFNKQYTEAEYYELRTKIIEHMTKGLARAVPNGVEETPREYGQLFPAEYSPFGYNETIAQEYFPLHKDDVIRNGWNWCDNTGGTFGKETSAEVADGIAEAAEGISKEVLACVSCKRNFQIIPQELKLYKQMGVALPRQCPNCRHLRRIQLRNPRRLWQRQCMCTQVDHSHASTSSAQVAARCETNFETTYSPDRKELIYCEQCYLKEIS